MFLRILSRLIKIIQDLFHWVVRYELYLSTHSPGWEEGRPWSPFRNVLRHIAEMEERALEGMNKSKIVQSNHYNEPTVQGRRSFTPITNEDIKINNGESHQMSLTVQVANDILFTTKHLQCFHIDIKKDFVDLKKKLRSHP